MPQSPYGERSPFEQQVRVTQAKPAERGGSFTPLDETLGIITPSALHFVVQRGGRPEIDPTKHRLLISGMVDRPVVLTMEEIKRLPSISRILFLECAGNSRLGRPPTAKSVHGTHGLTACSEWTGVPLSLLLREAGVQPGATWIVVEGADATGNERSLPLAKAMDDVLVAYGQNGEALRPDNGYPLRLVVPGWEGNVNVKWLHRITAVDRPPTPEEVQAWELTIPPDGQGLPPGRGTAALGKAVYAERCAACHGETGEDPNYSRLVGGHGTLATDKPIQTIGSFWPYATTLWSYIRRAQPFDNPGSLTADQVYAVTAYLLHRNGIIGEQDVLDAKTLPQVKMPNRDGFVPDPRPDVGQASK